VHSFFFYGLVRKSKLKNTKTNSAFPKSPPGKNLGGLFFGLSTFLLRWLSASIALVKRSSVKGTKKTHTQ
jgi:hypothetical protein